LWKHVADEMPINVLIDEFLTTVSVC
jgi:hypothetical protein